MTISNTYAIPVDGDKVFRSNKHGQAELKKMPGVQRIFVENRDNSFINQNGLIGLNFLRAFVNPDDENALLQHLEYGLQLGAENAAAYGADYFYTKSNTDLSRLPFYFKEQENASCYPRINESFAKKLSTETIENLSFRNAKKFIERIWF